MTIRRRITVASATAVAVTVVVMSIGAFIAARQNVLEPIDESLLERVDAITGAPSEFDRSFGRGSIGGFGIPLFRPRPGDFDSVYYQIIFPDGAMLNLGEDELVLPLPEVEDINQSEPKLRSIRVDDLHLRVVAVYQPDVDVIVQLARPLTEADETLRSLAGMLAVGSLAGIALAAGLGLLVSRNAVRPIEELRREVSEIAETQELGERIDVEGDDEVAELASAFNDLLAQLETSKDQQVRLVRDAGHELRTPLTALRMNLEILQRHEVSTEERATMLDAAHAEVEELSDLVAEIVDLATDRYEEEPMSEVALNEIVANVAERLERRNGRKVIVESDGTIVEGRPEALERAVTNIVANADKWSPDDAPIEVSVDEGTVTVTDAGPGIPDEDLPHVFDRFYRSAVARTTTGSGLGLSIVDQIVTDHGGEVFARNADPGPGAVVGFLLPTR
jgi:two-component system sensor histidine kinase MprB